MPAAAQFNPLSAIAGAIEAAVEDRGSSDIAADLKMKTAVVAALTDQLGKSANIVDDTVIEAKLKALYLEGKGINATNWRWRSVKGRVFLFGRALSKEEHAKAAQVAKGVSGVVSVTNRAKIRPKS